MHAISLLALAAAAGPTAGDADDQQLRAAEITVTARRRDEDAQQVPIALDVVDGETLARSYSVNTQQISLLVPTLNYSSANPRNTAFTIRGLGSSVVSVSQANDGLEPGVGFYVDQVYHARPATAAFDLPDLERVEVLRGPQGTLFGKNSTAGAINIVSRAPAFTPGGDFELSVGERRFVQVKAASTGPLGQTLAYRLSLLATRGDGVIDNVRLGRAQNGIGNQAVRGQLLFAPHDGFSLRLIADFTNFQSECCTQVHYRIAPTLRPAARQFAALAAGAGYAPPSFNPYDRLTDIDARLNVDTNEGGLAAIADWSIGGMTLTSVSAWRLWNWDAANDRDYTGLPIQAAQHIPSRQDQYSQEVRIASNGDRTLSYVAGLYFFRQRITGRPISIYGPLGAYWLIGPTTGASATPVPANLLDGYGTDGKTDFRSDSYAAFGEVNWTPLPQLTLTGGLRYTYEEKTGQYRTTVGGGPTISNAALIRAQRGIFTCQTTDLTSSICQAYGAATNEGALTGRVHAAWRPVTGLLVYANFARGAKSGGINMSGLPLDASNQPALGAAIVRPERNTAYELGLKAEILDRRITLNIDAYLTDVEDFQANVTDTRATAALRTYLANVPQVRVKGVEAELNAHPFPALSLRAALAYADGRYVSYPNGPCPIERIGSATAACDLSGIALPALPKWSLAMGIDFAPKINAAGDAVFVHADSTSRTATLGDPTGSAYAEIVGYTLVNASIGYRSAHGWRFTLFARNLFDANYIQNVTVQAGNSGLILATPSDPRQLGISFGMDY